ncbi:MAG: hypothetical protein U1D55_03970 [Phycisphaerae bacterium]
MLNSPVTLEEAAQRLVGATIRRRCEIRAWALLELAVRTNQVHVVVGSAALSPEQMVVQFKAYATRALRASGLVCADAAVWAAGAGTRYLWRAEQVNAACAYVREGQDVPR